MPAELNMRLFQYKDQCPKEFKITRDIESLALETSNCKTQHLTLTLNRWPYLKHSNHQKSPIALLIILLQISLREILHAKCVHFAQQNLQNQTHTAKT